MPTRRSQLQVLVLPVFRRCQGLQIVVEHVDMMSTWRHDLNECATSVLRIIGNGRRDTSSSKDVWMLYNQENTSRALDHRNRRIRIYKKCIKGLVMVKEVFPDFWTCSSPFMVISIQANGTAKVLTAIGAVADIVCLEVDDRPLLNGFTPSRPRPGGCT